MKPISFRVKTKKIKTATYIDASALFEGFADTYKVYYRTIKTAQDPFLTLAWLQPMVERMETAGVTVPSQLKQRIDELIKQNPHYYVDLEEPDMDYHDSVRGPEAPQQVVIVMPKPK